MYKVSVIIPTYNRSKYLTQAIESALVQDYPDLEVIVSDNASTDDTPQVVKKYFKDPRFKYFRNKRNLGMAGNWRRAIYEYATGNYAIILSDDDYFIYSSYVSDAINIFKQYKNVVLVFANQKVLYDLKNKKFFKETKMDFPELVDGNLLFFDYLIKKVPFIPLATVVFHRITAVNLNCFAKEIISADQELFFKMILNKKVGFIKKTVAVYRKHSEAATSNWNLDILLKNVDFILSSARCAFNQGFDSIQVEIWKRKSLKIYFNTLLSNIIIKKDFNSLVFLFKYIRRNYPWCLSIFFSPKNILKLFLSYKRNIYSSVRNIYWYLFKKESPPPLT